ncbi:MAG: TetR/AcrR family transcriptional regulator [Ktedonobacteraceae bacterium]|nr:TetR/AcrR family transcriptional regulator [Ktedonobacteraceae bacterium]
MEQAAARTKQQERADRILDAATDLLLRWGYKRITIEDIARQAGVGTGTVYLHWKTRDALFETLMLREAVTVWRELLERIRSAPEEVLVHRVMRSMLLIVMRRPLARALFTGDSELLGKFSRSSTALQTQRIAPSQEFFTTLRDLGLLRSDRDLPAQMYAFTATVTGFCLADPMIAEEDQVSLEKKAEALAQTVSDAFEPPEPPARATLQEVVRPRLTQMLEQVCDYCEQLMQEYKA